MPVTEIAKARKCGQLRFHCIYECPDDLNHILQLCRLKPEADGLLKIDRSQAEATLMHWLHREPAYDTVLMSVEKARDLADRFLREFADQTSRFFTNGPWFEARRPQSWHPFTDSIFDGGLLIASGTGNETRHVCIWFEDED